MSFCKDCVRGVRWEGTPTGRIEKINGVDAYIATPAQDYPTDKVLLFLTDIFGMQLVNSQLMADDFAANGFKTVIPDYLNGDPTPADALAPGSNWDIPKWFVNHGKDKTRPSLDRVIDGLKAQGVTSFGAVGYCFGARYVFDLAFDGVIKVGAVAHPSHLEVPEDIERYAKTNVPLLIESCEVDQMFPPELQAKTDAILGDGKFAPGYKQDYWPGCRHGFAVRGDQNDPAVKAGKEGAFKNVVEWMAKYL
ncbi:alpha/beta-hydrolase [Schizophyllum commune H4-8]|uniref:alpha/beta-hydrolase n=1 Tax=Schizophyllum commune (strain H4-8 / FGSC 9210) TaxID=578458 RepID=UPI00216006B9|nr:alpha/beta-hydrolase [Schizophyllum commune H4-8]KAI5886226.1 alpha/beta-hydrolase [Schizophyllum commune H4-8]